MKPLKVCIIGGKCYDLIAGSPVLRYLGGIETQLVVLAKGLAQAGCDVSLITFDHGQPNDVRFQGVRVLKSYSPSGGLPVLRHAFRTRQLWRAMQKADADIYLQMGAGFETGQAAFCCGPRRPGGRRFVFCMASNTNFGADFATGKFGWEGKVYQYGLRRSDLVIAQTLRQQEGLRAAASLDSQIIPMAVTALGDGTPRPALSGKSGQVLWIGRIAAQKRLEWLLEIASLCPQFNFDVIGTPNRPSEYATNLIRRATELPNVKVHGRITTDEIGKLYEKAQVLCCTATMEGFPTTFLEAWSCGLPVVTTFDPDGVVARNTLGRVADTANEAAVQLTRLFSDPQGYARMSEAALRYYFDNHSVPSVSKRFRKCFEELMASGSV